MKFLRNLNTVPLLLATIMMLTSYIFFFSFGDRL